ncbi:uncharacterized protein METZ01_LOCUS467573, partial [marine metagenome]
MMRIEAKRNATASQGLLPCFQHLLHALSLQAVVLFAVVLVSTTASQAQVGPEGGGASFFVGSNQRGEGGSPLAVRGFPNQRTEVFFYYNSPEDGIPGPEQNDHLQGFSMVFCYDCRLNCIE